MLRWRREKEREQGSQASSLDLDKANIPKTRNASLLYSRKNIHSLNMCLFQIYPREQTPPAPNKGDGASIVSKNVGSHPINILGRKCS